MAVEEGRIVDVVEDPDHPFTQGVISGKVHDYTERVYSPMRVLYPMRRVGKKGAGEFERISWGDAIKEIARRLTRVIAQWGPAAILPFSWTRTDAGLTSRQKRAFLPPRPGLDAKVYARR